MSFSKIIERLDKYWPYSEKVPVPVSLFCVIEKIFEWEKWREQIPFLNFKEEWRVKIIPPQSAAIIRFLINDNISVYLDGYDILGTCLSPYWEIYDGKQTYRFRMEETEELLNKIEELIDDSKDKGQCCHSCGKSLRKNDYEESFMTAMLNTIRLPDTLENLKMLQHHLGRYANLIYKKDKELKVKVLTCHECLFKGLGVLPSNKEEK